MVRLFITNLKREIGTKKEKNLSTRIACRGSRLVEVTGLEPAASASRTQRSTKLSHTSLFNSLCQSIVLRVSSFHESATLTLAVPEKTALLRSSLFFRPRRLFAFPSSAFSSGQAQSYQTEPHLVI